MAAEASEGLRDSSRAAPVLKKGPWTASEDLLLVEYVKKHGEGNWNAVQKNSGLLRCGKSCRLRWANHLRPHLKKGAFSPEEERLIVELHAKLGNKWARMASQLPGRTDNEIKNYWNTRIKRRQRAGLPIYPQNILEQEQLQLQLQQQQILNLTHSSSFSSLLSSTHHSHSHNHNNPNPFVFAPSMISPNSESLYTNRQLKLYQDSNGGIALSLDASNPFSSSSTFLTPGMVKQMQINSMVQYNSIYSFNFGGGMGLPLPSIQSAAASSSDYGVASDGATEDLGVEDGSRTGLLQDLFGESREYCRRRKVSLAGGNERRHGGSSSHGTYEGARDQETKAPGEGVAAKETKAPGEGVAPMDDELMNLLDNFPMSVPIPDWNGEDESESPILTNGTSSVMQSQPSTSEYNPIAAPTEAPNQDSKSGNYRWNNMPSIY